MTKREVMELINESIEELKTYEAKAKSRINDLLHRESDIQEGRKLLFKINRGRLFEDENGRDPEYESLVGNDAFKELIEEISRTANLVSLLKGDISSEVYKRRMYEIDSKLVE